MGIMTGRTKYICRTPAGQMLMRLFVFCLILLAGSVIAAHGAQWPPISDQPKAPHPRE